MWDFSIFGNSPLHQMLKRVSLRGPLRQCITLAAAAWLPPLILSFAGRPGDVVSYTEDIVAYSRLLFVIPILILAEPVLDARSAAVVEYLSRSSLIDRADAPALESIAESARNAHGSWLAGAVALLLAYAASLLSPDYLLRPDLFSWRFTGSQGAWAFTPAGWWYYLVSYPLSNAVVLAWLWKLIVWAVLLWRVSRLRLRLIATHPDQAGGLTFISLGHTAFAYPILAGGIVLSAAIAQRVVFGKSGVGDFTWLMVTYVIGAPVIVLAPLLVFGRTLLRAKIRGLLDYGTLADDYTQGFDIKWVRGEQPGQEKQLLGTSDIQSLADLGNSYDRVRDMRFVPFGLGLVESYLLAAAIPFVPLAFTELPANDVLSRILRLLT